MKGSSEKIDLSEVEKNLDYLYSRINNLRELMGFFLKPATTQIGYAELKELNNTAQLSTNSPYVSRLKEMRLKIREMYGSVEEMIENLDIGSGGHK